MEHKIYGTQQRQLKKRMQGNVKKQQFQAILTLQLKELEKE